MNIKIYTLWMLLYLGVLTLTAQEKMARSTFGKELIAIG